MALIDALRDFKKTQPVGKEVQPREFVKAQLELEQSIGSLVKFLRQFNTGLKSAQLLVRTTTDALEDERAVTDTGSVAWDFDTDGQAKANVDPSGVDHGGLAGLGDDDHTGYLLLAGRGGQTITDDIVITTAGDPLTAEVSDSATNTAESSVVLRHTTSANMVDGFATGLLFQIRDSAAVNNSIAQIHAARSGADNSGELRFRTNNAGTIGTRMTIFPDGHQTTAIDFAGFAALLLNDGNATTRQGLAVQCGEDAPAGTNIFFEAQEGDAAATGRLQTNAAGVFALADVSDERRKVNIAPTKVDALDVVRRLELIEFNRWKTYEHDTKLRDHLDRPIKEQREHTYAKCSIGLSAQNCRDVFPEMVSEGRDGLMTSKADLVPVLVGAVQRLLARVEQLERSGVGRAA